MIRNFSKIVWRTLLKNKSTSLINLVGLTIGLTTAFLIGLYVLNEVRTDTDMPYPERTFRLLRVSDINDAPYWIGVTSGPFAPALKQDYPGDVEDVVRVVTGDNLVQAGQDRYQEDNYYFADPNFLQFFDFPLLAGDPATALASPNSVVLTLATARRYFGDEYQAVGQTLRIDNDYDALVTGVMAEFETPTHFEFDLVESTLSLESAGWWHEWWNNNLCTYLRLNPGSSAANLERQLPQFMDKYFGKDFARTGSRIDLDLQPILSVYFEADTRYDPMLHGNREALQIFLIAALLLVVIACFNYVNLTTAKAVERSQEIGVYKVLGAGKGRIILQMMGESMVLSTISVIAACGIAWYVHPWFEATFDISLNLIFPFWQIGLTLVCVVLALTVMAGLYPGWLLSSFDIIPAIKRISTLGEKGMPGLRRTLVVFQFVLSVGLLAGMFIIQKQLTYVQNKDLGFDREQVLLIRANNGDVYTQRYTFREMLEQEPGVLSVSFGSGYPGGFHDATVVDFAGFSEPVRMRTAFVDFDYVKTYGLNIIAGRDFSSSLASDSTDVILLNERAVAELDMTVDEVLGLEGRLSSFDNHPRRVVGVVEDYNFTSLHAEIEPLVISTRFRDRVIGVKLQAGRIPEVIAAAEKAWNTLSPAYPFKFEFLDDRIAQLYENEVRQGRIFGLFGSIAILIACLGMFGLISFASALRSKEIGIRKVLGASVPDIVALLSKDFLLQVCVAVLIATPIAFYLMQRWLENFAYRIDLGAGVFVLSGLIALVIALATVSYQSIKAALSNPVDALRYE